jgi:hypothetical protein
MTNRTRYINRQPTRLHAVWKNMMARCTKPNHPAWERYGGRGICVCAEWSDYDVFADFCEGAGYRDDLTIDRIDNDKGYEPGNVRFVSLGDNVRNRSATQRQRAASKANLMGYWDDVRAGRRHQRGNQRRVVRLDTGEVFASGAAAGRAIERSRKAVWAAIRTGTRAGGCQWAIYNDTAH